MSNIEHLQTPRDEGLESLERDLTHWVDIDGLLTCINVTIDQLNDGSGISTTLKCHKAKYHKTCRSYCSSSCLKRTRQKQDNILGSSPNKLRSSLTSEAGNQDMNCCIICEGAGADQNDVHKVETHNLDSNFKEGADSNRNCQLLGRMTVVASGAHAGDVYYHTQCYLNLRDSARAAKRLNSAGPAPPPFDTIVTAEIVALIEDCDSKCTNCKHCAECIGH